ncbi:MAG: heptose kinase [Cellvibrionaceae bacterium]|nr:heptose kinase [Cellvibrionaceae bacterium]MAZ89106.1 heptose kinase [Cellvibrionaceae bacterium]|tara:strand:+ start:5303 stop:6061 length:759 start_codon:yes stop_codon:yes gene_type:complete
MINEWWIDDGLGPEAQAAFASLEHCFQSTGDVVSASGISEVQRLQLDGKTYYLKLYFEAGARLNKYLGKSKVRREWENLLAFKRWGLSVAKIVVRGEQSTKWLQRRGVLITEGVDDSVDLAELARQSSPLLKQPDWLFCVIEQVAQAARVMHQHRFAHNDLKWRNILVSGTEDSPVVTLIDCPSGRYWSWPFWEYRRMKDLACLDTIAKHALTKDQRVRFMRRYWQLSDGEPLSKLQQRKLKRIASFFSGKK